MKNSLKANIIYQMIYEVLLLILPFITSPYIARVLGAEGLGIFSYSVSFAYYFVIICSLGLKTFGNRLIAQVRDDELKLNEAFSNLFFLHIGISSVVLISYIVFVLKFATYKTYAAIQIIYVLSAFFDISWLYFGIEEFKLTVKINSLIRILNVICVFWFVKTSNDLPIYCLIYALGMFIAQFVLWFPLKRYVRIVKPKLRTMISYLKPMIILFIPVVAVSLYKYMDKIMIGNLASTTELGFYENAEKIVNLPTTIVASFGTVMLPKISNLVANDNTSLSDKYMNISMRYIMCLAFALSAGLAGIGKVFAPIFWGEAFYKSGMIIMLLSLTIPFVAYANIIRTQYLMPKSRDKEYLISVSIGALINLFINYMLIPQMGALGAAIGTIVAEATVSVVQNLLISSDFKFTIYIKDFLFFAVSALVMFWIVYFIGKVMKLSIITLFLQVFVGIACYSMPIFIYLIKTKDEIIKEMLNKLKARL